MSFSATLSLSHILFYYTTTIKNHYHNTLYHIDISKCLKCAFFNDKYIRRENNKRIPQGTESKFEKYVRETWWWETQKNRKTFGIHEIALWSVFLSRSSRGEKEVRTARMVRAAHVSGYFKWWIFTFATFMFYNLIFFPLTFFHFSMKYQKYDIL